MIAPLVTVAAVTMSANAFAPGEVTVLTGETVTWSNQDARAHTATAADGSFDSGSVPSGGTYSRRFERAGVVAYRCRLHRFMQGRVEVVALDLRGPDEPVDAGDPAELTGRAPEAGVTVTLERDGRPVATAVAADDGAFRFRVGTDAGPARYRARSGDRSSAAVLVAPAPRIHLAARRGAHAVSVRVHVDPPQPGATVTIDSHVRERFAYLPVRRLRLDAHSRARVVLHTRRRLRLRARLVRPVGGFARSASGVVVVPRTGASRGGAHHPR